MTNFSTTAIIKLFPNTKDRIQRNEADLNGMKTSTFPIAMYLMMTILSVFPTWYVQLVGANWFASAILSNFPGPREVVSYFQKYAIPDIVFWAPHLNGSSGIGISMLTYNNSLRFALNVDSAILPSQEAVDDLCAYIEEELESLQSTTVSQMKLIQGSLILIFDFYFQPKRIDENENKIFEKSDPTTSELQLLRIKLKSS